MSIVEMNTPPKGMRFDGRFGWVPEEDIWHPILFKGRLVLAILEGRKTQTRRMMQYRPVMNSDGKHYLSIECVGYDSTFEDATGMSFKSPYGATGHYLWVRETWATDMRYENVKPSEILLNTKPGDPIPIWYGADKKMMWWDGESLVEKLDPGKFFRQEPERGKGRPSIFMPRWASRISLRVRRVGCERLQDIMPEDALAEGVEIPRCVDEAGVDMGVGDLDLARQKFRDLWDSVNDGRVVGNYGVGWRSNPWIWVVEFEVIN